MLTCWLNYGRSYKSQKTFEERRIRAIDRLESVALPYLNSFVTLEDVYNDYKIQFGKHLPCTYLDKMLLAIFNKVEGNEAEYERLFNEIFDEISKKDKWTDPERQKQWIQEYQDYKTHFEASNLEEQIRKDLAVGHSPEYLALLEKRKHPIRKFFEKLFK